MAKDTGEEKNLPPSVQKLRKMRKDGQVSSSKEFISISVFLFVVAYGFIFSAAIHRDVVKYFRETFSHPMRAHLIESDAVVQEAAYMLGQIIGPLGLCVLIAAVASSALIMRGFPFSLKPLALKMDRLNPATGIKQIFSARNGVDLLQSIVKFLICFLVTYFYVKSYLASLLWAPLCGTQCTMSLFQKMFAIALGLMVLGMFLIVAIDLKTSKWLFLRDAKMSISELKRELKEEHGDPHIKQARRQEGQRMVQAERRYSFEDAHFLILGDGVCVGINFMRGASAAPVIASVGFDQAARGQIVRGQEKNLIQYSDPDLARDIAKSGRIGKLVPFELFDRTARAMVRSGFLS